MADEYDPQRQAKELWRENLWLRDLLTRVAQDLEALAHQPGHVERGVLGRRALRIRQRLWEGPPQTWDPMRLGGMPPAPTREYTP